MQIVNADGSLITEDRPTGIACSPAMSAIDSVDVFVNGKLLRTYDMCNYVNHIITLCQMDAGYISSTLANTALFTIDGGLMDNPGNNTRRERFETSTVVDTFTRPFVPVFQQLRYIPLSANI